MSAKRAALPYVGRGGLKLEHALDVFGVSPRGKICLDIGASTGGFTDCLIQRGALKVYAVDVGRGQLAWKLRQDPRVIVLEKTNARYLSQKEIPETADLCTMDVSFISVMKILPAASLLLKEDADIVALLKPQFEAGPKAAKHGVVRNPEIHEAVLQNFIGFCGQSRFSVKNLACSPVTGADGNIEFFVFLRKGEPDGGAPFSGDAVRRLVAEAHQRLGRR